MTATRTSALMAALSLALAWPAPAETELSAEGFAELKGLIGNWETTTQRGSTIRLSYELISDSTVLLERFSAGEGRSSLTVYHRDGDDLVATHYCPEGNQPRLRLAGRSPEGELLFEFRDATNLEKGASHLHAMRIELAEDGRLIKRETYRQDGRDQIDLFVFRRPPASQE